jgi:hypothetical protein
MIGTGPENFVLRGNHSLHHINASEFQLQESDFQVGQIICVRPPSSSTNNFWLAKITDVDTSNPITKYNLNYLERSRSNFSLWKPMKGKGAYGDTTHLGIIYGPVILNMNGSIKMTSLKHIQSLLKKN